MRTASGPFARSNIQNVKYESPYFLFEAGKVVQNLEAYHRALPKGTEICFAMKANSQDEVLHVLQEQGASFEVASNYELAKLQALEVPAERIVYGTAVKSESSLKAFVDYGVDRFAFDSEEELRKIARQAPGSRVYVRVLVSDEADSVFTMSEKFGTNTKASVELLLLARELGLKPYGISFNVGSQARNAKAWANGLTDVAQALRWLDEKGVRVDIVDLGGGFPFSYIEGDGFPDIAEIGAAIIEASHQLPYPIQFLAEPGRGLVADAYVLVVGVFAKTNRPTGHWLYVDAGAYNALLETMAYQGSIEYTIELLRDSEAALEPYIVTGPTGDSLDVVSKSAQLPADVAVGDKLVIRDTGAYSFVLTTPFNGFPTPPVHQT